MKSWLVEPESEPDFIKPWLNQDQSPLMTSLVEPAIIQKNLVTFYLPVAVWLSDHRRRDGPAARQHQDHFGARCLKSEILEN